MSFEARGKSCGVKKLFLPQRRAPFARKSLDAISPVAAHLYELPNCSPVL